MRAVTTTRVISEEQLRNLPIFPLPRTVLFPNTVVSLHVFELRYRQLIRHCLRDERPFAVWLLDPAADPTRFGPGIQGVATVGRVRIHHALPDGRLNVVVEGLERVRFLEEVDSGELYRVVRTERHPLAGLEQPEIAPQLETLRALVAGLMRSHARAGYLLHLILSRHDDPAELSDILCSVSFSDRRRRQSLLETSSIPERLDRVIAELGGVMLRGDDSLAQEDGPRA